MFIGELFFNNYGGCGDIPCHSPQYVRQPVYISNAPSLYTVTTGATSEGRYVLG